MWTEIMSENVAVVHVDGCKCVIDIGNASEKERQQVKEHFVRKEAREYMMDNVRELERQIARRNVVRDRLRGTEYEGLF